MKRRRRDLDRMVDALLAGDPLPSGHLEPDEIEALRAAIDLRAARPGADLPEEDFVTGLRRRLAAASSTEGETSRSGVPRRALLVGAAAAVAAGVVGAAAERSLTSNSPAQPVATGAIVPDDGQWVTVATADDVAGGQVKRFAT